ncbi:MAG: hypothetical protein HUJ51_04795 [Eggerthellaceae bacterium]|nr:hypothetical protein [Eggerthellaceae bacterium]
MAGFLTKGLSPNHAFANAGICGCCRALVAIFTGMFGLVALGFVLTGLAAGGTPTTNLSSVRDFSEEKNFLLNYSIVNTNLLTASFSSTFAGILFDVTGTFAGSVCLVFGLVLVGLLAFLGIRRPK